MPTLKPTLVKELLRLPEQPKSLRIAFQEASQPAHPFERDCCTPFCSHEDRRSRSAFYRRYTLKLASSIRQLGPGTNDGTCAGYLNGYLRKRSNALSG